MFGLIFLFLINFSVAIDEKYDIMAKTCYGEDAFTSVTINASYLRVNFNQLTLQYDNSLIRVCRLLWIPI